MNRLRTSLWTLMFAGALTWPGSVAGQATAYVSLTDPAYLDLDALVGAGLVHDVMLGRRPYSQATFTRAAAEAARRVAEDGITPLPRIFEALTRIRARFGEDASPPLRGARIDVAVASTPSRAVQGQYGSPDVIDADVAPLLQRNEGRTLADGGTLAGEIWDDARLGSRLVVAARPRVALTSAGGEGAADFSVVHAYARGLFGNLSVEVGRNSIRQGLSREMGTVLSANARGLDMVRLSMEEPRRLPWVFRHLGPVFVGGTLATLGNDRDNPGGILVVWEGSMRPHPNLEMGLTLMNQQGGEGAPEASFGQRLQEAFFIGRRIQWIGEHLPVDPQIGDKFLGADVELTLPGPGLSLYAEYATTDDHDLFITRPRQSFWAEAAWLWGARWQGLGPDARVDLWAEAARNGVRPYTHEQLTSGLTLDRRILGSPLGPLATAFQGGVDWTGPRDRVSFTGVWERYHGDEYHLLLDPWRWTRLNDNPDEVRLRITVDWRRSDVRGVATSARLGYEHVSRFDFRAQGRTNLLAQVSAEWSW